MSTVNYNTCPRQKGWKWTRTRDTPDQPAWNERCRKGRGFETRRRVGSSRRKASKDRRRVQLALLGRIDRGDGQGHERRNPARLKRIVSSDALRPTSQHFPGFSPLVFVRLQRDRFNFVSETGAQGVEDLNFRRALRPNARTTYDLGHVSNPAWQIRNVQMFVLGTRR